MEYDNLKAKQWLERISSSDDPLAVVVSTHLFVEYALDYLISTKASSAEPVVEEILDFKFAKKAQLIYKLALIPKELYDNIIKLNKLRNAYAHDLNVDFSKMDLDFFDPKNRVKVKDFHSTFSNPPTDKEIHNVLGWIGLFTFGWLNNLIRKAGGQSTSTPIVRKLQR